MIRELGYLLDGMSRDERLLKELLPESVELESRDTVDLLKFVSDLSRHLIYYNDGNRKDGNWEGFFKTDFNILNQLITKFNFQDYLSHFRQLEIELERAISDEAVLKSLRKIFYFIFSASVKMHELTHMLGAVQRTPVFILKIEELLEKITTGIGQLRSYNKEAAELFNFKFINDEAFEHEGFPLDVAINPIFGDGKGVNERVANAFPHIKEVFNELRKVFNRVLNACKFYTSEHPVQDQEYSPHIALVITFLELYAHLKSDINQLPAKHLDFYYRKILGFENLPAEGDQTYLVFEPLPDAKPLVLKKGELLNGLMPQLKDEVNYALTDSLPLSKANISSLKTLFSVYNDRVTFSTHSNQTVPELKIYQMEYDNPSPTTVFKNGDLLPNWPMLGMDIDAVDPITRSQLETSVGLLIASPILFQKSGTRKIKISIMLSTDSFQKLRDYVDEYEDFENDGANVQYRLLEHAFSIKFTTETGWERPRSSKILLNKNISALDIEIFLDTRDALLSNYSAVHGTLTDFQTPVIRLLVNTKVSFNPLTYLRYPEIERINITAKAIGCTDYIVQNNLATLDTLEAFQPFGALAPVGSYFDIVNANIFNRFLNKVGVNLEWAGLPETDGGFETHYQHYSAGIKNGSFRASLSNPQKRRQENSAGKNEVPLFDIGYDANFRQILKPYTRITHTDVDVRELAYVNDPIIADQPIAINGEMEGALRITLTSPQFGFGHGNFTTLFSQVAIHNAKRFVKKRPFPEQPYTPQLNAISIDYTQTASIQLDHIATDNDNQSQIKLVYLHPFGHEHLYPGKIRNSYPLIPSEDFENNFYIGFDKLTPGEELSILFYLEEKTFHDEAIKLEALNWSYLYDNSWIRMNDRFLLSDGTGHLIKTGIVRLIVPSDISLGNTIMPADRYWIRIAARSTKLLRSKIKAVYLNASNAKRILDKETPLNFAIPPGVIKKFVNPIDGVQNIWQLFPSTGGKLPESKTDFLKRVSERLRHKNRLLLARDIEQAILQNFPEIMIAKCIRPKGSSSKFEDSTVLKIVLVAYSENLEMAPMVTLDTLCKVKEFLIPKLSPLIEIRVENPVYEEVKVVCRVSFVSTDHSDQLLMAKNLENDINEFISPWVYRNDVNYRIGRKLYVSEMFNFIKSKPYIASVDGFSIGHFFKTDEKVGEDLTDMKGHHSITEGCLIGSIPEAIFIPAEQHFIEVVHPNHQQRKWAEGIGLNHLIVGEDLFIGEGHGDVEEASELQPKPLMEPKPLYNWIIPKKI